MWEEIACEHTDGRRLTNYYIDNIAFLKRTKHFVQSSSRFGRLLMIGTFISNLLYTQLKTNFILTFRSILMRLKGWYCTLDPFEFQEVSIRLLCKMVEIFDMMSKFYQLAVKFCKIKTILKKTGVQHHLIDTPLYVYQAVFNSKFFAY